MIVRDFISHNIQNKLLLLSICIASITMPVVAAETKSIEELFENSMLAVASYLLLEGGKGAQEKLKAALINEESDWKGDENVSKRKLFTEKFSLPYHLVDTDTSDFSATIFKRIDDGQITFASKGTAEMLSDRQKKTKG